LLIIEKFFVNKNTSNFKATVEATATVEDDSESNDEDEIVKEVKV
jgi:hypothetical protein